MVGLATTPLLNGPVVVSVSEDVAAVAEHPDGDGVASRADRRPVGCTAVPLPTLPADTAKGHVVDGSVVARGWRGGCPWPTCRKSTLGIVTVKSRRAVARPVGCRW